MKVFREIHTFFLQPRVCAHLKSLIEIGKSRELFNYNLKSNAQCTQCIFIMRDIHAAADALNAKR